MPSNVLATATNVCLYEQIANNLHDDIVNGIYVAGSKVPSVRALSRKLGVSVSTAIQAYSLLESRGVIFAKPQSGFFVSQNLDWGAPNQAGQPQLSKGEETPSPVTKSDQIRVMLESCQKLNSINLGAAIPALELLPYRSIQTHIQKATRFQREEVLSYQFSPGYLPLRALIAQRMRHVGVRCHMDDVVITQGCTEALNLSLRCHTQPGDVIAVESPCYYGFLQMAENLGLDVVEIPTDFQTGMSIDALRLALQQWPIKVILLGSRFSNPTGSIMPRQKQQDLVELANKHDVYIIEDDIYGEIDFTGKHNSVLKTYDTEERVLYCSSFSKTVAPGLRVGWCLPGRVKEKFIKHQSYSSFSSSSLSQVSMASFLKTGHYDKHLRKLIKTCQRNIDGITSQVHQYFPSDTVINKPQGGFVIWVALPKSICAIALQKLALDKNITLVPGGVFSKTDDFNHYIRLNCALVFNERIKQTIADLGEMAGFLSQE